MSTSHQAVSLGRLGRYELIRRLASGGMGELFLARASSAGGFEKLVAIKRILPHLARQPEFVQMFLDEARVAASLEHPNIVHVSDLGQVGDEYFLVMPFLEGGDLATLTKRLAVQGRRVPVPIAACVVAGVAAGLEYAHTRRNRDGQPMRLIHRDVSPENIFVTFAGEVKLLDFGIAKVAQIVSRTDLGTRRGKARYMSPEQANGEPLDARSDVFSLGVVLYELTCGRPLFAADDDLAVLQKLVSCDPPPPSSVIVGYPPALEQIVLTALRRDPSARWQSAGELRAALDRFARSLPAPPSSFELGQIVLDVLGPDAAPRAAAGPASLSAVAGPPAAPSRSGAPLAAVGLAVVAAASGAAWWWMRPPSDPSSSSVAGPSAATSPSSVVSPPESSTPSRLDAERLLALLNDSRGDRVLSFEQRHEAMGAVRAAGLGDRIDELLQISWDLLQAHDTAQPCARFDAALTVIEKVTIPYFAPALSTARVPRPGAVGDRRCDDLDARRLAALRTSGRGGSEPTGEPQP